MIAQQQQPAAVLPMRVLVIEDDKETAQFLQRSLRESGHAADIAEDGEGLREACPAEV